MRWFAWCLMVGCAITVGCNQPVETIPSVAPVSSGTTGDEDHAADHDHVDGDHDHDAVDAAPAPVIETESEAATPAPAVDGDVVEETTDDSAANSKPEVIRFVADKKINVPDMMCPYSCWPAVKETLAAQPGVEGVQLAEQPSDAKEGEIVERVVELKINDKFDSDKAIAALAKASYEAQVAE